VAGRRDSAENRQSGGGPRVEAIDKVGRAREPEILQCRRCEARLIALLAHEHDSPVKVAAQPRVVVTRRRIAAPFEDVARVEDRARNEPAARALDFGTDVDDERAIAARAGQLPSMRLFDHRERRSGVPAALKRLGSTCLVTMSLPADRNAQFGADTPLRRPGQPGELAPLHALH
jgi:hypothetical protein